MNLRDCGWGCFACGRAWRVVIRGSRRPFLEPAALAEERARHLLPIDDHVGEAGGQRERLDRARLVGELEVEVRLGGVAAVADLADDVAGLHPVADLDG